MTKTLLAIFIGSLLLYILVLPGNHSEAEDAFEYSRLVEEGRGAHIFHPNHLLYIPMQKGVFRVAKALGYSGRAYYIARAVSMVSGALALCFFHLMVCRLHVLAGKTVTRWLPCIATMGLLFSYGFVRYACEVEIYLPALALALAAAHAALHARGSRGCFVAGIVLAALAVLMHTINSALALVVVPLFYLLVSGDRKKAFIHAAATGLAVALVYAVVQGVWGFYRPLIDTASEGLLRPDTIPKAMVGLGQCLLSANFAFAYDAVAERLQEMFPYRVFIEERFAASYMPTWLKAIAPLTFTLALTGLGVVAVSLVFRAIRNRVFDWMFVVLLLWLGGTMFPTIIMEPSNPELWILSLAPLWALVLWMASNLELPQKSIRVFGLAIVMFGTHNLLAGMGSVKASRGDYHFRKAEWILEHAEEGDVINTADSHIFTFYLNYWGKATVRNVNSQDWKEGNATYVFDDVFNPPAAIGVRYPHYAERVAATAEELKPRCRKIHDDQFGGVWKLQRTED